MKWRPRSRVKFALRSLALRDVEGSSADWKVIDTHGDRALTGRMSIAYVLLTIIGTSLTVGFGHRTPIAHPRPWLSLSPFASVSLSCFLGVFAALVLTFATRRVVARYRWARALHQELRPIAIALTPAQIALIACLSSLGEEVFFRGFLTPALGFLPAALIFAAVHQLRGASRWVWSAWALVGGLTFGAIFCATGSLLGAALAHGLANASNLYFLREVDLEPRSR